MTHPLEDPTPDPPPPPEDAAASPALAAMRAAMQAAAEAADARAKAKASQRTPRRVAGGLASGEEDYEVLAATARDPDALEQPTLTPAIELEEGGDVASLVAELDRLLPEQPGDEVHGELVIKRGEEQVRAWYELAAEAALPQRLREVAGPVDVKGLLTALLVEIGDVKRTNALLMEQLARIEEKVDRTNRSIRPPR
ncbi:MAG: hypothetical protein VKQ33_14730 [Candidatus Sericytochromatia bacterium]|nr:hypothetical protein [Candidatus Sericytochromatia bacterium]